jgi:hypothetical protein
MSNRIQEPSTWAGVAGVASSVVTFLPPQWQPLAGLIAAITGAVAVFLRERGGGQP